MSDSLLCLYLPHISPICASYVSLVRADLRLPLPSPSYVRAGAVERAECGAGGSGSALLQVHGMCMGDAWGAS